MSMSTFLQKAVRFEIQAYRPPRKKKDLKTSHVAYSGAPYKHPYDSERMLLVVDPYSSNTFYYEFNTRDIAYAEEISTIVNLDEETVSIVRIWVRKKSIGIRCSPFLVGDTI